jgi:hypothetical protein
LTPGLSKLAIKQHADISHANRDSIFFKWRRHELKKLMQMGMNGWFCGIHDVSAHCKNYSLFRSATRAAWKLTWDRQATWLGQLGQGQSC